MATVNHGHEQAAPLARLDGIQRARRALLSDCNSEGAGLVQAWITRSWQRCLALGHQPRQRVSFDAVSEVQTRRTHDANQALTLAARSTLHALGQALADTRYFAILTNADGVVVDTSGPIDRGDRRAELITRVGVDLSERSVGTTAIGAALTDLHPVWLHRGEHFFDDTAIYSCAGAPLFGPNGRCVGMLDLTGVDVPERSELLHLAVQSARNIENALAMQGPHAILLRLNWPGHPLGGDSDALVGLDADGCVSTCNRTAREMVPALNKGPGSDQIAVHASELFAMGFEALFDAARHEARSIDVPLWSGLHLQALALPAGAPIAKEAFAPSRRPNLAAPVQSPGGQGRLRDIETALIRKTVQETRGNVAEAAARLGVSRATVYRRLGLRRS